MTALRLKAAVRGILSRTPGTHRRRPLRPSAASPSTLFAPDVPMNGVTDENRASIMPKYWYNDAIIRIAGASSTSLQGKGGALGQKAPYSV